MPHGRLLLRNEGGNARHGYAGRWHFHLCANRHIEPPIVRRATVSKLSRSYYIKNTAAAAVVSADGHLYEWNVCSKSAQTTDWRLPAGVIRSQDRQGFGSDDVASERPACVVRLHLHARNGCERTETVCGTIILIRQATVRLCTA